MEEEWPHKQEMWKGAKVGDIVSPQNGWESRPSSLLSHLHHDVYSLARLKQKPEDEGSQVAQSTDSRASPGTEQKRKVQIELGEGARWANWNNQCIQADWQGWDSLVKF